MASTYDDSVFNFDLDFLHQPSKNTVQTKLEKQRKAIAIAKKKTIATDSLIRKYYNKKEVLEQTEKNVFEAKEECKQICIDYKNALERCTKLENDIQILENRNKELDQKYHNSENHYCALQSHAKQLQILAKENETLVESLKIENQLEKANAKSCEKKANLLEKENDSLHKFFNVFKEVLLGKKKLTKKYKNILLNYEKFSKADHNFFNETSEEEISDNETYAYDSLMSPHSTEDDLENHEEVPTSTVIPIDHKSLGTRENCKSIYKNDDTDRCSDYSNEVASADTGRGSSLAFSDSEKCFHSPEYCSNDVPVKSIIDKSTRNLVSIATSPIAFQDHYSFNLSNIVPSIPKITVDKCVSPINNTNRDGASNLQEIPMQLDNTVHTEVNDNENRENLQQKECLQINSSNNFNDDNGRDCEIESIFKAMRFNQKLITPIPLSPAKSHDVGSQNISCGSQTNHSGGYVCEEAEKVRQENKILHTQITDLANEIMKIKSLLQNHPIISAEKKCEKGNEIVETNENNHSEEVYEENAINMDNRSKELCEENVTNENNHSEEVCEEYLIVIESVDANEDISSVNNDHCTSNSMQSKNSDEIIQHIETDQDTEADHHREKGQAIDDYKPSLEPNNTSIFKLQFEEAIASADDVADRELDNIYEGNLEDSISTEPNNNDSTEILSNDSNKRITRTRRLTKLEKLRKRMVPRCKIGKEIQISKKATFRAKRLLQSKKIFNKSISNMDKSPLIESSVTLNDKTVYEKAVKIMSELNCKQAEKFKQAIKTRQSVKSEESEITRETIETEKHDIQKTSKFDKQKNNETNNIITVHSSDRPLDTSITTRSRSKCVENFQILETTDFRNQEINNVDNNNKTNEEGLQSPSQERRKRLKRLSVDKPDVPCKRVLRSDTNRNLSSDTTTSPKKINKEIKILQSPDFSVITEHMENPSDISNYESSKRCISYDDMEMFTDVSNETQKQTAKLLPEETEENTSHPKESILCHMINKYKISVVRHQSKKVPDAVTNSICKTIEDNIAQIINLPPNETKDAMDVLVDTLQNTNIKEFMSGLMKYLQSPQRKIELFSKVCTPPAPPMTKSEQILLYIISQLNNSWSSIDVVDCVLNNIEYLLFKLNRTPEFDVIESISHFYAILCRYFQLKTRLRVFVLDALYCMQYKAIALIKQCIDVWMHILPLAHMGIAKNPLVTCLVYVMHFYKCEDAFNRVKDIRFILNRRYSYQMLEWNETKMLEMFRNAIRDLRDNSVEKKILRISLILIAKRQGPKWCQKNIITNILQPVIEKDGPERIKTFCVAMLGPLLKPYPVDMKVHCEIIMNQLIDMLQHNPTSKMQEAIFMSLMYMSKHNQNRVIQAMLRWFPKSVSPECEEMLRDFVRDKPAKIWKIILSKISLIDDEQCNDLIT